MESTDLISPSTSSQKTRSISCNYLRGQNLPIKVPGGFKAYATMEERQRLEKLIGVARIRVSFRWKYSKLPWREYAHNLSLTSSAKRAEVSANTIMT